MGPTFYHSIFKLADTLFDISYAAYALWYKQKKNQCKKFVQMKSKKVVEFTFEYIFDDQMSKIGIMPKQLLSNYLGNVI